MHLEDSGRCFRFTVRSDRRREAKAAAWVRASSREPESVSAASEGRRSRTGGPSSTEPAQAWASA
jgi:hypothetical protein